MQLADRHFFSWQNRFQRSARRVENGQTFPAAIHFQLKIARRWVWKNGANSFIFNELRLDSRTTFEFVQQRPKIIVERNRHIARAAARRIAHPNDDPIFARHDVNFLVIFSQRHISIGGRVRDKRAWKNELERRQQERRLAVEPKKIAVAFVERLRRVVHRLKIKRVGQNLVGIPTPAREHEQAKTRHVARAAEKNVVRPKALRTDFIEQYVFL